METTTIKDIETLIQIKTADDIKTVNVVEEFIDDKQWCAVAEINGATIEVLWHDDLLFLTEWQHFKGELFHMIQHDLMMHHIEPLIVNGEATEEMLEWADRYDAAYAQ